MNEAGRIARTRRTARVLLAGGDGRVLLFRYVPEGSPAFWMLPGGELDPHEDFAEAARRELFEETGIDADPAPLGIAREFHYTYEHQQVLGVEHFFLHRTESCAIDTSGHTPLEQVRMQEHRWFALEELEDWPELVWPKDIAALLDSANGLAGVK
ncbi:MAG: NUDIX hydrolase [Novosphingobium sp.]